MQTALTFSFEEMYLAMLRKDPAYEGRFITAVKTTHIFCRPTCTARKPLRHNVTFFSNTHDAIVRGYRACKICKPLESNMQTPDYIIKILKELERNPTCKIKDYDLVLQDIEPNKVRRWFKTHHQMTFHSYQRLFRINNAYQQIIKGDTAMQAGLDQGYESLSGFNEAYKKATGTSPSNSKQLNIINMIRFNTPIGPMMACASDRGVCLLEFTDRKSLETELNYIKKRLCAEFIYGHHPYFEALQAQLQAYFEGQRHTFDIKLDLLGTEFQQAVWQALMDIPYGQTRSYSEQAQHIQRPLATRAVARANGMNRISIIVPCHRVIGQDGRLVGYGGGLPRKKWLLEREQQRGVSESIKTEYELGAFGDL